ncbi:exodeoxyribonuclease V subunit gamma [Vibrio sp. ZSDE26]|uniref:RecBCD enzyme subunit RecC n=1 Tax=Vibrio amylolyticus TaxID=2847292 RepID=A0A9X2BIK4_9VIBR|nr:exodeoxyribonuclease V subunit gamma [Vibrio amylolyticus]MCK6262537.1 exodeoxyribonuclease V subunit gamma [Vibrio amylolyticus]
MFTVYHSNQIDILKSLLVELVRQNPLENPFEKEQILVQSPGMSQWLKMELAKEFGIAANLEFPLPATFIWELFTQILPDVPKRSAFNKEAMTWKLMHLLPSMLTQDEFQPLARYLDDDDDHSKRYQLVEKIADIFDGYLVYRPEWIASWEAGHSVAELEDEHPWQPILWQALYDYTLELEQSPFHRANLYEEFIDTLAHYQGSFEYLPKRLFVFGISSLPPRYMDALKAIGEHIDVHLMFTNPCRYYWGDVRDQKYLSRLAAKSRQHVEWHDDHSEQAGETEQLKGTVEDNVVDELHTDVVGNNLLASLGKLGRDNMFLLSQLESHEIEAFVDIPRDSLLHNLQADILNLEEHQDDELLDSSHHKQAVEMGDHSVSLHACHSAMREVEVLYDQLLGMFDDDASLKPRDIIVMVPDINAYSPAIQAVFGNAPGDRYIPFSISDRTATQESPILAAFMQLVDLPNTRCLASELLELLETPAMMAKFGLDDNEFAQAKRWIEETGIRWGLNGLTAKEFELPETSQNTWQFGIQRMLLGYAMSDDAGVFEMGVDSLGQTQALAPYNEVQGMQAELAGKLAHFIDLISLYRTKLSQTQSIENWRETLNQLLDDFFEVELEGEVALKSIRDTLISLKDQLTEADYQQSLAPSVVSLYLNNKLSGTRVSQRFLAGQVNFCTLMPMRSIPFDVVCLLGMNDGVYPPNDITEGFDYLQNRFRAGDRSRREDSRYMFLEAILSANKKLYASYVGRSIQDNTAQVPSVLISELMEYCQQNYCLIGDEARSCDESGDRLVDSLISQHAMVPFSPSEFSSEFGSYAREWLPAVNRLGLKSGEFDSQLDDYLLGAVYPLDLDVVELQRFWRLPVQYFFNRRLKVVFEPPLPVMEDDEPFVLNGLESYQMRDELLDSMLKSRLAGDMNSKAIIEAFVAEQRAQGKLPVGSFGDIEFETNRAQAEELVETLAFICSSPLDDIDVNIKLDVLGEGKEVNLTGWLTQHFQSGLVRYRSGKIRAQDYLSAWIDHLLLSVSGYSKPTHIVGYDRKEGVVHEIYPPIDDSHYARDLLNELVRLYYQGMTSPLCYFPKTALASVEAGFSRGKWVDDEEKSMKKIAATFNDSYMATGEGANVYISRIWPQWNDELAANVRMLSALVIQTPRLAAQNAADAE